MIVSHGFSHRFSHPELERNPVNSSFSRNKSTKTTFSSFSHSRSHPSYFYPPLLRKRKPFNNKPVKKSMAGILFSENFWTSDGNEMPSLSSSSSIQSSSLPSINGLNGNEISNDILGFSILLSRLHYGRRTSQSLCEFLRQRIEIEEDYAKKLHKLSTTAIFPREEMISHCNGNSKKRIDSTGNGSGRVGHLSHAIDNLLQFTSSIAQKRLVLSESIKQQLLWPLDVQTKEHQIIKHQHKQDMIRIQKSRHQQSLLVSKLRAKYYEQCKNTALLAENEQVKELRGRSLEKYENAFRKSRKDKIILESEYQNATMKHVELFHTWKNQMTATALQFGQIESSRLDLTKKILLGLSKIESQFLQEGAYGIHEINDKFLLLDAAIELRDFVNKHGTGKKIPEAPKFRIFSPLIDNKTISNGLMIEMDGKSHNKSNIDIEDGINNSIQNLQIVTNPSTPRRLYRITNSPFTPNQHCSPISPFDSSSRHYSSPPSSKGGNDTIHNNLYNITDNFLPSPSSSIDEFDQRKSGKFSSMEIPFTPKRTDEGSSLKSQSTRIERQDKKSILSSFNSSFRENQSILNCNDNLSFHNVNQGNNFSKNENLDSLKNINCKSSIKSFSPSIKSTPSSKIKSESLYGKRKEIPLSYLYRAKIVTCFHSSDMNYDFNLGDVVFVHEVNENKYADDPKWYYCSIKGNFGYVPASHLMRLE